MRGLIPVVVTVALVACDGTGPIPPESDTTRCEQTYEFGNLGCADVTGTVLDSSHRPQPAAYVRVLRPAEPGTPRELASATVTSAADGTFRLRIRLIFAPSGVVEPDTITAWVRASRLPRTTDELASTDSALALLTLRPVGEVPVVTPVPDLVLRVP